MRDADVAAMKKDVEILENCMIRECCEQFGRKMSTKLIRNNRGLLWRKETVKWLVERLMDEVRELDLAIQSNGDNQIIDECIDVAVFAMMIQDVIKKAPVLKEIDGKLVDIVAKGSSHDCTGTTAIGSSMTNKWSTTRRSEIENGRKCDLRT